MLPYRNKKNIHYTTIKKKKYESEKQSDSRKFSKKNHKYSNLWRGGIEEEILDGTCRDVCTGCGRS